MTEEQGAGDPAEPTEEDAGRRCENPDCGSADPRQHVVWVAEDRRAQWTPVHLCTSCAYVIRTCSWCVLAQPVDTGDKTEDVVACGLTPPPWERVEPSDWCEAWRQESAFTMAELLELLGHEAEQGAQVRHLRPVRGGSGQDDHDEESEP